MIMSDFSIPTSRKRHINVGDTCEADKTPTSSWFEVIGDVMGDILQNWGVLSLLKRKGWTSLGSRTTPNPASYSQSSASIPEQIELSHFSSKHRENGVICSEVNRVESLKRRGLQRVSRCDVRPQRHSFYEGSSPESYLLTAALIHSLKHGPSEPCINGDCRICCCKSEVNHDIFGCCDCNLHQELLKKNAASSESTDGRIKRARDVPSRETFVFEMETNPIVEDDLSSRASSPVECGAECNSVSSLDQFYTATEDAGFSSENTSNKDTSECSYLETPSVTLSELLNNHASCRTSSFFADDSFDSATLTDDSSDLPIDSVPVNGAGGCRSAPFEMSSSVSSLPVRMGPNEGGELERPILASGSLVLISRRPSLSSSTVVPSSQFQWEENPCYLRVEGGRPGRGHDFRTTTLDRPAWCDACAHLVFYHATTCHNCGYTCHEQCQKVVSLDCSGASVLVDEPDAVAPIDLFAIPTESAGSRTAACPRSEPDIDASSTPPLSVENQHESDHQSCSPRIQTEPNHPFPPQDSSTLKETADRIQSRSVAGPRIEEWVQRRGVDSVGLQIDKETDGVYRGCIRIHLNLSRPINIVAGTRPPSIYDILQEDRTMEKTLTSFYMPRDAVKAIHITNKTTSREVIVALLKKFKVVDNPQKFALYERTYDAGQSIKAKMKLFSDHDCPLALAIEWSRQGLDNKRIVLQENDTADIQWEAFSLPELENFLQILDREELEYKNQIREKYRMMKTRMEFQVAKVIANGAR